MIKNIFSGYIDCDILGLYRINLKVNIIVSHDIIRFKEKHKLSSYFKRTLMCHDYLTCVIIILLIVLLISQSTSEVVNPSAITVVLSHAQ